MNPVAKYLQETRAELRHVAWPTQTQTIVYTVMVALLSVGVSLYLGFFDFMFTSTLTRMISALPSRNQIQVTQQPVQTQQTAPTTNTPTAGGVQATPLAPIKAGSSFDVVPADTSKTPTQN